MCPKAREHGLCATREGADASALEPFEARDRLRDHCAKSPVGFGDDIGQVIDRA